MTVRKDSWPKVSVIITNYKDLQHLRKCLEAVLKADYPSFEIVVVDCLTHKIKKWIRENYFNVKIVHFDYDIGPAAQHNVGADNADTNSKYLVFLDNDTEVEPKWLKELVKAMESDPTIGAAQSKLLMNNRSCMDSAGGYIDRYGYVYERGHGEADRGQYKKMDHIFYAKGASMIIRRDTFENVGRFDEEFFVYYDETDLCWRIWLQGYRVVFVPQSIVYHAVSATIGSNWRRVYFQNRNHMLTLIKNSTKNVMFRVLLVTSLSICRAFVHLLQKEPKHAINIIKAYFYVLRYSRNIWLKRLNNLRHIKINFSPPFLPRAFSIFPPFYFSALST